MSEDIRETQMVEAFSSESSGKSTIDLATVRQDPLVSLKNISGIADTISEPLLHAEDVQRSVKAFFSTVVANLTEEQIMDMIPPKDPHHVQDETVNLQSLLYATALVRSGIDISTISVGELTQEEIYAVEHGSKNISAQNNTSSVLRSSFAKGAMERLTQAKQGGDDHAEEAMKELQRMLGTDQTNDRFWKLIGMMPEQFAGKVASINNLRKSDFFVTQLSEEQHEREWPETRKQAVQKNLGLKEDQMYLITTYRLHLLLHK